MKQNSTVRYLFGNAFGHLFLDKDKAIIYPLTFPERYEDNTWESVDLALADMGLQREPNGHESLGLMAYRVRLVTL